MIKSQVYYFLRLSVYTMYTQEFCSIERPNIC